MCLLLFRCYVVFFFKQKTAYEMRISDWSSDVCSSDLAGDDAERAAVVAALRNLQIAVVPRRELEPAFGDEVEESVGRHRRRVMDRADHLFILMRAGDREHTREARTDRFGFLAHEIGRAHV